MITSEEYQKQQQDCAGLCDVGEELVQEKDFMRCVKCPFCHETVDAILTPTTIACPSCKVEVARQ